MDQQNPLENNSTPEQPEISDLIPAESTTEANVESANSDNANKIESAAETKAPAQSFEKLAQQSEMAETLADGLTLREIIDLLIKLKNFVFRHWWRAALFMIVGGGVGVMLAKKLPPKASASFEIRLVPKTAANPVAKYERSNVEYFQAAEQNFKSLPLVRASLAKITSGTVSDLDVTSAHKKLLFYPVNHLTYHGQYQGASPDESLKFLKAHVQMYLDTAIEKTLAVISAEASFLRQQLTEAAAELRDSEQKLRKFKEDNADGLPEQAKEHYLLMRGLEQRKRDIAGVLKQYELELKLNREKLAGQKLFVESKVISTQRAQPYQSSIVDINKKIATAKASGMRESHPEFKRLMRLASYLQKLSNASRVNDKTEIERSRNPIYQSIQDTIYQLEVQEAVTKAKFDTVCTQLKHVHQIVKKLPTLEAEYADPTRNYDTTRSLYDQILKQLKVTQLQYDLERASTSARYDIYSPPHIDVVSFKKTALLRGGILAVLGALLALTWAIIIEVREYVQ